MTKNSVKDLEDEFFFALAFFILIVCCIIVCVGCCISSYLKRAKQKALKKLKVTITKWKSKLINFKITQRFTRT